MKSEADPSWLWRNGQRCSCCFSERANAVVAVARISLDTRWGRAAVAQAGAYAGGMPAVVLLLLVLAAVVPALCAHEREARVE